MVRSKSGKLTSWAIGSEHPIIYEVLAPSLVVQDFWTINSSFTLDGVQMIENKWEIHLFMQKNNDFPASWISRGAEWMIFTKCPKNTIP